MGLIWMRSPPKEYPKFEIGIIFVKVGTLNLFQICFQKGIGPPLLKGPCLQKSVGSAPLLKALQNPRTAVRPFYQSTVGHFCHPILGSST